MTLKQRAVSVSIFLIGVILSDFISEKQHAASPLLIFTFGWLFCCISSEAVKIMGLLSRLRSEK